MLTVPVLILIILSVRERVGLEYVSYVCTGEVLTPLVCRGKGWSLLRICSKMMIMLRMEFE